MTINPTPKQRFQASTTRISNHREMIASDTFSIAADFALMEYQMFLSQELSNNPNAAGIAGLKMNGAVEFLTMLKLLGEMTPKVAPKQATPNLDHNT